MTDPARLPSPASLGAVRWSLRGLGMLDLCALIAVFMPGSWIEWGHSLAGLGSLPTGPIVGYLARSASAMYALHGALLCYVSLDVARYWKLIRFLAIAAILHAAVILSIDLREGMPTWWLAVEGPAFAGTGLIVLIAQAGQQAGHVDG